MTLSIEGLGTALPEHHLTQEEAVELHATFCRMSDREARTLRALYRRSGIETRHSVVLDGSEGPLPDRQSFYPPAADQDDRGPTTVRRMAMYERHAPSLATSAAREALGRAGVEADEVTHLVTVSCTGFVSPGVDAAIVAGLGLPRDTERTHVGFMGCHGALNGLRLASSFTARDPQAVPLVCAVELCSLHFAYGWDPEMLVANALFSDGAAALVGRAARGEHGSHRPVGGVGSGHDDSHRPVGGVGSGRDGSRPEEGARSPATDHHGDAGGRPWRVAANGTFLMGDSEEAMTWRIGDHGFRMTLSAEVPDLIEAHLRPWMVEWLDRHGLALADVGSWAVHPGGPRILSSVERALELPAEATAVSRAVLSECGNMSSATVLFIMDRMRAGGAALPCVALAFGPGLVAEATLLT